MIPVVLASQSPSRRSILHASGIDPVIIVSEVDERSIEDSFTGSIGDLTLALSEAKAHSVIDRIVTCPPAELVDLLEAARTAAADPGSSPADGLTHSSGIQFVLLAADSLLELDGAAIGKPGTAERTRQVWADMAGRWTVLHSGHSAALLEAERSEAGWAVRLLDLRSKRSSTSVLIGTPSPAELEAYIATEEPFHVAGALTIDGYGGAFVEKLEGDHLTVLGLGLPAVRQLITDMGLFWPELWSPRG